MRRAFGILSVMLTLAVLGCGSDDMGGEVPVPATAEPPQMVAPMEAQPGDTIPKTIDKSN